MLDRSAAIGEEGVAAQNVLNNPLLAETGFVALPGLSPEILPVLQQAHGLFTLQTAHQDAAHPGAFPGNARKGHVQAWSQLGRQAVCVLRLAEQKAVQIPGRSGSAPQLGKAESQ